MLAKLLPFWYHCTQNSQCQFSSSLQQLLKWHPPPMSNPHLDDAEAGTAGSSQVINKPKDSSSKHQVKTRRHSEASAKTVPFAVFFPSLVPDFITAEIKF